MDSILNVEVSCFADYNSPQNPRTVNLITWLTSSKYRVEVEAIRGLADKEERAKIKKTLPAITPSGLFAHRHNTALIKHSGLICLDIDLKGNEKIKNYADLKREISKIRNVAYCGLSVSGTGFFVLIPISQPESHRDHFNALRSQFLNKYKIRVDNTPDVARLRGYSYDPDAYFNHRARPYTVVNKPEPIRHYVRNPHWVNKHNVLHGCLKLIEDATDGEKHDKLNRAAFTAGGYVAGGAISEDEAIDALEDAITRKPNVRDREHASRTIKKGIRDGLQRPIYEEAHTPFTTSTAYPAIVRTIAEQQQHPGSILRPYESQIERLVVEQLDSYPPAWDEPVVRWNHSFTSPPLSWDADMIRQWIGYAVIRD